MLGVPDCLSDALDNLGPPLRLPGTSSYEARHRGVGADGSSVIDSLAPAGRDLAGQAEVLGNGLARVPTLGDKHGDEDDVLRLDVLHNRADFRVLVQETNLNKVVEVALSDAVSVQVDHP